MKNAIKKYPVLFVIIAWTVLIVLRASDRDMSLSVLTHRYDEKHISFDISQKITGEFVAKEDNLGIVGVRLDGKNFNENNKVIFRLKEKHESTWYYENTYRITWLPNTELYPFGFPIIKESGGNSYIFEIEGVENVAAETLTPIRKFPVFNAYYKFYRQEVLGDTEKLWSFLIKKVNSYFSNWNDLRDLTISIVVLLFILVIIGVPVTFVPLILTLSVIVYETFVIYKISETAITTITLLGIYGLVHAKAAIKTSYSIGIGFLLLCSVMTFTFNEQAFQKAAIWGFIFLCIGFVQDAFVSVRSDSARKSKAQRKTRLKLKR